MNVPKRVPRPLDSVYGVWVKSFSLLLILFFCLFIIFARAIIFTRLDLNISSLLERALTITWEEYNQWSGKSTTALMVLAEELEAGIVSDESSLTAVLNASQTFDFWLVTDFDGRIIQSSANDEAPVLAHLSALLNPGWQTGRPVASSEILALEQLRDFSPLLAQRASIDHSDAMDREYDALFQVVAVPYRNREHQVAGALIAAHLLNNDNAIAHQLADKIPDSFSTISAGGIRVSGNISSQTNPSYVGRLQTPDHIRTIQQGKRYYGRITLANDLDHLVVSDPIRNTEGRVIGALTIGHPSQGLASLKQDTVVYIALSALLCWVAVFAGSALASRRWAAPITNLSRIAKRIYEAETIKPEHLALVGGLPSAATREIEDLQLGFSRMAVSLYEKNQEILGHLDQLEARVEAKTMELRNAMMDLVATSNLKSKFLANTSHELRTPLNSIIGFSEMLSGGIYGELTQEQRDRIQIITDSARHLLTLINDLLDVSRIEQGKMPIDRQVVSMEELVASAVAIIRSSCEQNGIAISAEQVGDVPPVFVDPTRIRQVLYNVLSNAVKFTPPGGSISVETTASPSDGEVIVSVKDTGIGISENDQLYVFDEFYQGENTGYRKQAGFGLGLPLSKKLVELHGGRIELKSGLGEGTTVTLFLPMDQTEVA